MPVTGGGRVTPTMTAEDIEGLELMVDRTRRLDYPTFDVDNHLYENRDALTKFVPAEYEGIIKYVDVGGGRTKLAFDNYISDFIPNPSFVKVAPPGGRDNDPHQRRYITSPESFFDPEPRLHLLREFGIDRVLMFPTLACLVEQRLRHDWHATHAVIHGYNEWLFEHWSYEYEDCIYTTPIIPLSIVSEAIRELETVLARGAKVIQMRFAPVPGPDGPRSFALPEFDPFWKAVEEADILVASHASDSGYTDYPGVWEGTTGHEMRPYEMGRSPAFLRLYPERTAVADGCASIIGHGLATRFPKLRIAPVEYGTGWIPGFVENLQRAYDDAPMLFDEEPYEVFKRNIYIHCFRHPNPQELVDIMGIDHVMWGSDFPHMEGLNDPVSYVDVLDGMSDEDHRKIMGGNLARIMKVG
jgi:predicted TIM-barrel fold metal-dependent hydrolase